MTIKAKNKNIDMLTCPLTSKLLLFTLPIALSSILQQLFNAADTSIVGFFGDPYALAAVGTNGEIIALIVTLSSGLSIGVNILVANKIGQNKLNDLSSIVQTSVVFAFIFGVAFAILGQAVTLPLLKLIQTPANIMSAAQIYFRIYLIGYPFLLLYDFGAAILRAQGNSRFPFFALVISGISNVILNLLFVIVFRLGVAGVAIATDISTMLSAGFVLYYIVNCSFPRHNSECYSTDTSLKEEHVLGKNSIQLKYIRKILSIGIPAALQGAVFCFANIFVQASVNSFGAFAISGSTIAMNFEYFAYYGITAFGQTATTFASQNYSAGKTARCKKILMLCLIFSTLTSIVMIAPIIIFRDFFCGLFTTEQLVMENAVVRIMCILLFEPICCFYEIPAGVLRGCGHSVLPAASTIIGTCVFRIVWICTVFSAHPTLPVLYSAFPLSWCFTIVLIIAGFGISKPFSRLI
ncbi:MATE family efflux transporter [Agathobacter sp.]